MAARPSAPPSPQARRQAQLLAFQAALGSRDSHVMQRLLGQWVHRHGVGSLAALGDELAVAEPDGWAWWQATVIAAVPAEAPAAEPQPLRLEPQLPRATRPAPAPSHPALVQLRSWLPDQEERRAA